MNLRWISDGSAGTQCTEFKCHDKIRASMTADGPTQPHLSQHPLHTHRPRLTRPNTMLGGVQRGFLMRLYLDMAARKDDCRRADLKSVARRVQLCDLAGHAEECAHQPRRPLVEARAASWPPMSGAPMAMACGFNKGQWSSCCAVRCLCGLSPLHGRSPEAAGFLHLHSTSPSKPTSETTSLRSGIAPEGTHAGTSWMTGITA